jgi:hypothetical protein
MTRRDEALSSLLFSFCHGAVLLLLFLCKPAFFSSHQHRACNQLYSSHRYVRVFFSSRLYAFPLCNHIHAKSDWVGSEWEVRTGTLLYCTYKSLTHTPKTNPNNTSHNMTYNTLVSQPLSWAKLESRPKNNAINAKSPQTPSLAFLHSNKYYMETPLKSDPRNKSKQIIPSPHHLDFAVAVAVGQPAEPPDSCC